MVHHHFVDHHLREERRGEPDQLDRERGEQHLAPDALVAQELGHEPPEAERLRLGVHLVGIFGGRRIAAQQQDERLVVFVKFRKIERLRFAAGGIERHHARAVAAREDRGRQRPRIGRTCAPERDAWIGRGLGIERCYIGAPGAKTERGEGGEQLFYRVRRRKLPEEQRGVERHAVQRTQLPQGPDEIIPGQGTVHGTRSGRIARRTARHTAGHALPLGDQNSPRGTGRHPPAGLDRADHPMAAPRRLAATIKSAREETSNSA